MSAVALHGETDLERLIRLDGTRCHYCQRQLRNQQMTKDHKIPKSRGGSRHISNLVIACQPCNCVKGDMTDEEFLAMPYTDREALRRKVNIFRRRTNRWGRP